MSIRRALFKFRIMPLTIMALIGLFSMKAYDVYKGTTALSALLAGEAVAAGEENPSEAQKAAKDAQATPEEKVANAKEPSPTDVIKKAEKDGATEEKPADAASNQEMTGAPTEEAATGENLDTKKDGSGEMQVASVDKTAAPSAEDGKQYSQVELDILQSLSKRRDELDQWENDIKMKENLLNATEQRINDKIGEIKSLQGSVSKLLAQYNDHEDTKIKSLVKIYENMKPKDAAQIFDEMEMPILLEVIDKMSERKAAPILAQMTPHKAKEVTVQLAEQKKLIVKQQQALDQMN